MDNKLSLQEKIKVEIKELSTTISEVVNSYRKLQNPLMETQENVPKAAQQLDKVSEQTEAATQQMLDKVENITKREEEIINGLSEMKKIVKQNKTDKIIDACDNLIEKSKINCEDAYTIMDSLQFQDITSQQLSHAISLLEDVESKFNNIFAVLQGKDDMIDEENTQKPKKERAFDPHADLFDKKTEQSTIDNIFANKK